uniref:Tetraspanin n=1 Tax=Iconisemion striatum TaxID=60296 RepID=A0A1A7YJ00_9TELE
MSALTSWELCVKYALFIFNFVFWLAGTAVLAVGLWLRFDSRTKGLFEGEDSPSVFFTGVYILIASGALMMVVGFLGCCGAIRENKCLLLFFFMLILFIFLAELAAAILAFLFREHLTRAYFSRELKRHYQGRNSTDVFTSTWNVIMTTFDCCGVSGPEDFDESLFRLLNPTKMVPETCCQWNSYLGDVGVEQCTSSGAAFQHNKLQGCYSAMVEYFETYIYSAGALAIVVLAIELFAMVFAMCLFRGIQ